MLLQGYTADCSLPELFKILQDSRQTGRLALKPMPENSSGIRRHFLWFDAGNLVAASDRLDGLGLLSRLQQRSCLRDINLPDLVRQCPAKVALGEFLKDNALLSERQLKSLFAAQILHHMHALLQAPNINFAFQALYPFPYLEMTGIKTEATELTLPSLRLLKAWGPLIDKLPQPASGLQPVQAEIRRYRLTLEEKEVLRLAQAENSLSQISTLLDFPIIEVQKIGFRLIFVGVVREITLTQVSRPGALVLTQAPAQISETFLDKLSSYLQQTYLLSKIASPRKRSWTAHGMRKE